MCTDKKIILPNGQIFHPKHYTNCRTFGIVYLLLCNCGCYYVGKAKMKIWRRAYRHIKSMQCCNPDVPFGRHFKNLHDGKIQGSNRRYGSLAFHPALDRSVLNLGKCPLIFIRPNIRIVQLPTTAYLHLGIQHYFVLKVR